MSRDACIRAREMIVDAMLRRLPPYKNDALSEHLGECLHCRAEVIEMQNELTLLTQPLAPGSGWRRRA